MLFSAIAMIAFTGSAFASNTVVEIENSTLEIVSGSTIDEKIETSLKKCIVEVTHRDDWGNIKTTTYTQWYSNDSIGDFMCYNFALGVQKKYDPSFQHELKKEN